MTDRDASPASNPHARRAARHSALQEIDQRASSGLDNTTVAATNVTSQSSEDQDMRPQLQSLDLRKPREVDKVEGEERRHSRGAPPASRPHRHRSSGAFLLSDPIFGDSTKDDRAHSHRRHPNSVDGHRGKPSPFRSGDNSQSNRIQPSDDYGLEIEQNGSSSKSFDTGLSGSTMAKRDSLVSNGSRGAPSRRSVGPLDLDSAQIVNMALNLSESRRLAARRNTSHTFPPRLAPLPDGTPGGGSLRQHLQQQRRASRNISPKPERTTPRMGSSPRVASPLQSAFDPSPDGVFRYRFSQSTLARAQKAKDYLELLAQYRRLLEFVPPLKPEFVERPSTASPPGSPSNSAQVSRLPSNEIVRLGREYNPLQYIRNRKVRTRERKAIDGEAQGFNDVPKVQEWVDEVAKWIATGQSRALGQPALPPFTSCEENTAAQASPPSASSRPILTVSKPKRPRIDWVIDPADMIADIYWLEQGDNKRLVEDRHWRRVFPQGRELFRPLSAEVAGAALESTPGSFKEQMRIILNSESPPSDSKPLKAEPEHVLSSAKDRAHQKLRALRGNHHRRSASSQGRNPLRLHRASLSEGSDEDSDTKRRHKDDSMDSTGKDILEKQMMEMIRRENTAQQHVDLETSRLAAAASGLMTPEKEKARWSPMPSRGPSHSRRDSRIDLSEAESNRSRFKPVPSNHTRGRSSLEVPGLERRSSNEYDTTQPNSPDLKPSITGPLVPGIGMDLSPTTSRPSSPTRNPLSKVKSLFRDRSRERERERERERTSDSTSHEKEEALLSPVVASERHWDTPKADEDRAILVERKPSRSPSGRKLVYRPTDASHKSQRSVGSIRLRGEDGGIGLRGLFRGPRIDSVLRTGVSKVSDMLFRRDNEATDLLSPGVSSDESDGEPRRGRDRGSAVPSRTPSRSGKDGPKQANPKSYLGVMPPFHHVASSPHGSLMVPASPSHPASRAVSRRSSRFDLLKPPKIDVQTASPKTTPPSEVKRRVMDSDVSTSDPDSRKSSWAEGVRTADARLNAVLAIPSNPPPFSGEQARALRHWSIGELAMPVRAPLSRREAARLRTLILSSGVRAMEIDRRAKERKLLTSPKTTGQYGPDQSEGPWNAVARLCPDPEARHELLTRPIAQVDLYRQAGHLLGTSVQASGQQWQASVDRFALEAAPALHHRVEGLRLRLAGELSEQTRRAADEADEVGRDLVTGQRLKVKSVVDIMDKMLRRKNRRFRWVRRATWLVLEWFVVSCMWWLWFLYLIWRSISGVGRAIVGSVRWLLWL